MKNKNWLHIPILAYPYFVIMSLLFLFKGSSLGAVYQVVFTFFANNIFLYFGFVIFVGLICFILHVIYVICFLRKQDPFYVAKKALKAKLILIPAYIINFILSVLMIIAIWVIPFVLLFVFIDVAYLIITGIMTCMAIVKSSKITGQKFPEYKFSFISQFFFVLDLVGSIILVKKLRPLTK